jgi:hypothetical protein
LIFAPIERGGSTESSPTRPSFSTEFEARSVRPTRSPERVSSFLEDARMLGRTRLMEQGCLERKAGGLRRAQRLDISSSVENRARVASPRGVDPSRTSGAAPRFRLYTRLVQHGSVARVTPPWLSADTQAASGTDERWFALIGAASKPHSTDTDSLPHMGKPCGTLRTILRA